MSVTAGNIFGIKGRQHAKKLFIIACFLFISYSSSGKNGIDSIRIRIGRSASDTELINLKYKLSLQYLKEDKIDSAYSAASEALKLSQQNKFLRGEAYARMAIGRVYILKSLFSTGIVYLLSAKQLFVKIKDGDGIEECNLQLGVIYYEEKKYTMAYDLFKNLAIKNTFLRNKSRSGLLYYLSGLCLMEMDSLSKAEKNLLKSHQIFRETNQSYEYFETTLGLANLYLKQHKPVLAKKYYEEGLEYCISLKNPPGMALCYIGLGNIYKDKGDVAAAISYFEKASLNAYKAEDKINFYDICEKASKGLADLYFAKKDYANAFKYQSEYYAMRDSIMSADNIKALNNMQAELDMQKKQAEIDILNTQHQVDKSARYLLISLAVAFIILASSFYVRYYYKRRSNETLSNLNAELEGTLINLKSAQQHLVQQEKMASLGQLTAGIAHEINNPVNFISGNIRPLRRDLLEMQMVVENYQSLYALRASPEQLLSKLEDIEMLNKQMDIPFTVEEIRALLKGIEEGATRTAEIVKGLRNFSRLDENVFKPVNIHEGLDSTLLLLNSQLGDRIALSKDYGNIPVVNCYPGQLNQVFMNILTNAIHAISGKGLISIQTRHEGNFVKVSIKDTGSGMSEAVKSKIFDPFFTTKDVGKGTGLGLSISYGIINKHNGSIEVKSATGEGTEFIIRLPIERKSG